VKYWPGGVYGAPESFQVALLVVDTVAILVWAEVCCLWYGRRCHQLVLFKHVAEFGYRSDVDHGSIAKIRIARE
jgi:hypothetical protein